MLLECLNRDVQNWPQLAAAAIISQLWPSRQNLLDRYPISQTACSSSSASHPRPTTCTALTYYKHISLNIRYFSIYFLHQASNDIQMRTVWKRLRSERNWALCASSTADEMMSDGLSACFYLESRVMRCGYQADIQKQLADSSIAAKLSQQLRAASNFERPYSPSIAASRTSPSFPLARSSIPVSLVADFFAKYGVCVPAAGSLRLLFKMEHQYIILRLGPMYIC